MSKLRFIVDVDDKNRAGLLPGYTLTGRVDPVDQVRNDQVLAFTIEPVTVNPPGSDTLYSPDWLDTDIFRIGIGLPDETATGGKYALDVSGTSTGLTALDYNVSAAALQTPLSAAFVTEGYSANTVTLTEGGAYQIDATTNGAIPAGTLTSPSNTLQPDCDAIIVEDSLGSASSKYRLFLFIRQSPVAYAEPATALPDAGVTLTTTAAGSSTSNKIQTIGFDAEDTYSGTYSIAATAAAQTLFITSNTVANPTVLTFSGNHGLITGDTIVIPNNNGSSATIAGSYTFTKTSATAGSIPVNVSSAGTNTVTAGKSETTTCGVSGPNATAKDLGLVLANHPQIYYLDSSGIADNISVRKNGTDFIVTFTGTLGNSTVPALSVTNIDLVAPQGVSGTISLNTIGLYRKSLSSGADSWEMQLSIQRERVSGEVKTLLLTAQILRKDIIDVTTMVSTPMASYYTTVVINAGFVHALPAVTGYTGGGSTNLDGVATTGITVPEFYTFRHSSEGGRMYLIRAGTDAEASPSIIRPDDYNASTNAKVWESII